MPKIIKRTMHNEKLISLKLAKALFKAGAPQKSKWYWMFNNIGNFWDCVHRLHIKEYPSLKGLKIYAAFKENKIGKQLLYLHPQRKHFGLKYNKKNTQ